MKNAILLANIGNRNLVYQGDFITANHFYATTEMIWDDFERRKEFLDTRILDPVIEEVSPVIKAVFLFSSEQKGVDRTDQDTFFAGEILCRLYSQRYPGILFQNIKMTAPVTDTNALSSAYRWKLRKLIEDHPKDQFILCDAGGTAQQKSSLKIILEFLLGEQRLKVYNVLRKDRSNSMVVEANPIEYRRVINDEQTRSLIRLLEYEAALKIRGVDAPKQALGGKDIVNKLLLFAHLRSSRMLKEAENVISNIPAKQVQRFAFLKDFQEQIPLVKNVSLKEIFRSDHLLRLGEDWAVAHRYFTWKDYSKAILSLAIFYENLLGFIITDHFFYDLDQNYEEEQGRMLREAETKHPDIVDAFGSYRLSANLKFKTLLCEKCTNERVKMLVKHLSGILSYGKDNPPPINDLYPTAWGINTVRNKIAHEGLFIDQFFVDQHLPYLVDWINHTKELLEVEPEDIYETMNGAIEKAMM